MDAEALPQRSPGPRRNRNPDSRPGKIPKNGSYDSHIAQTDVHTATSSADGTEAGQNQHFECNFSLDLPAFYPQLL